MVQPCAKLWKRMEPNAKNSSVCRSQKIQPCPIWLPEPGAPPRPSQGQQGRWVCCRLPSKCSEVQCWVLRVTQAGEAGVTTTRDCSCLRYLQFSGSHHSLWGRQAAICKPRIYRRGRGTWSFILSPATILDRFTSTCFAFFGDIF